MSLRTLEVISEPITVMTQGKRITVYQMVEALKTRRYLLEMVQVYDMRGRRIDAKQLPKLLKKEIIALVSDSERAADPLNLRLFKEDTLLFITPPAAASAATGATGTVPTSTTPLPPPSPPAPNSVGTEERSQEVRLGKKHEDYTAIFDNVLDVVSDHFEVAYANRYEGRIETATRLETPAPSPHSASGQAATTEQPIRRRAAVQITEAEDGRFLYLVHIQVFREAKVRNAKDNNKLSPSVKETNWEVVGRDSELEQVMLQRLIEKDRKEKTGKPSTRKEELEEHPNGILVRNVHLDAVNRDRTISVVTLNNGPCIMNLPVTPDAKIKVKGGSTLATLKITLKRRPLSVRG